MKDVKIGGWSGGALDLEGNLYTWGSNSDGELGTGDF